MSPTKILACLILALMMGCGGLNDRVTVNEPTLAGQMRIGMATLEIKEPSLPGYAVADEISIEDASGLLVAEGGILWADKPQRAIALELTRHLTGLTRSRIASSPWPFEEPPDGILDLRFETFVARSDGTFLFPANIFLRGSMAVAKDPGSLNWVNPLANL